MYVFLYVKPLKTGYLCENIGFGVCFISYKDSESFQKSIRNGQFGEGEVKGRVSVGV